ncbi:MAG: MBL fold metallo-hydrolase [Archangium sp.]|nr:MBL fold metallo-hydrolase [Archangium sp.]
MSSTSGTGLRRERVKSSKQFDGKTFKNPTGLGPGLKGNPLPLIGEYFFGTNQRMPPGPLPLLKPHEDWGRKPDAGLRATWLGHSTVLLELDGFRVLTDPVFGERASPLPFAGPKRFHPTPSSLDELPELDAVLLSHDHYDHLCRYTMLALAKKTMPIVTSLGVGQHLENIGIAPQRIHELDWGESVDIKGVRFTAEPCQHFSGRGLSDRNSTLWASYVIQTANRKVFFSGDTGLTEQYKDIGARHGKFDLVMLEVGAWHESWGAIHLGPANALTAFEWLGGGTLFPVHWGTFNLALHDWDEPAETLIKLAGDQKKRIITPRIGQVFVPERIDGATPWWREVVKASAPSGQPAVSR